MSGLLVSLYMFSIIFGPKFGAVDLSLAIPVLLFPFIFGFQRNVPFGYVIFGLNVMLLMCYQVVVQVFAGNFDFDATSRLLRSLIDIFLVGFLFSGRFSGSRRLSYIKIFVAVIAVHSLLIVVFAIFPSIGLIFSTMLSADRQRAFRSPGLMAGYDIAGLLSIFGLLAVVSFGRVFHSNVTKLLLVSIFVLACAFASRVSLAIALLISAFFAFRLTIDRQGGIPSKLVTVTLVSVVLVTAFYYLLIVMAVTFSLDFIHVKENDHAAVISRFAQQDSNEFAWSNMLFFPNSVASFIFGVGGTPKGTDIGYVREIFSLGAIGLLFAMWSHALFIWQGWRDHNYKVGHGGGAMLLSCAGLMLLLSLKNDYFFVRGVFPAFLIIVGIVRYSLKSRIKT